MWQKKKSEQKKKITYPVLWMFIIHMYYKCDELINFIDFFNFNIFIVLMYFNRVETNFPPVTIEDKYFFAKLTLGAKQKIVWKPFNQHKYFIEINL